MSSYFLNRFEKNLNEQIARHLKLDNSDLSVVPANEKFDADLAVAIFGIAKEQGRNPNEFAKQLANDLILDEVEKLEAVGGFLNIYLKPDILAKNLGEDFETDRDYGEWPDLNSGKTVVCDYPSANIAKPLSVGHMRPALQGAAIDKLLNAIGYRTISDDHLGDSGRAFGLWVAGFQKYGSEEKLKKDGIYELADCYIKITADLKAEKQDGETTTNDAVQGWLIKLESGDKEAAEFHKKFMSISNKHMLEVFGRLGVKTDLQIGESFYVKRGHELVDELLAKGLAEISDGAAIVRLDEYGIETPMIVRKANGASLYASTDLATIEYRDSEYSPDKVFICAGAEQKFYFNQLEALRKKAGLKGEIEHVYWGFINQSNDDGTKSKMSSRSGVVHLAELLDRAEARAAEMTAERDEVSEEDVKKIALGAIKFNDFAQDRKKDILFDWDKIFSLQGFSGPFVQYAGVRIRSIFDKAEEKLTTDQPRPVGDYDFKLEKELLIKLVLYPGVIKTSAEKHEPHHLATYAFELAKELNKYYEEVNILQSKEDEKTARLWLLNLVYTTLENCLGLLGIDIPSKM